MQDVNPILTDEALIAFALRYLADTYTDHASQPATRMRILALEVESRVEAPVEQAVHEAVTPNEHLFNPYLANPTEGLAPHGSTETLDALKRGQPVLLRDLALLTSGQ